MSCPKPIKQFEEYINQISTSLHLDNEEKEELKEEWKQHLYDNYQSLVQKGKKHEDAVEEVISQFGDIDLLQQEVNQTYPSARKQHLQKELIIWSIILLACLIGPYILIRAHFQIYFILAPLQALMICYLLYHFIIKRLTHPWLSVIGVVCIYLFFANMFGTYLGRNFSFDLYVQHLFSLDFERLTGTEGLVEFVTIHMLWYMIIVWTIIFSKTNSRLWKQISHASFHYWLTFLAGLLFARGASSAEWRVLFMNVFLLYGFLQQIVSPQSIMIWKEKVLYWVTRRNI